MIAPRRRLSPRGFIAAAASVALATGLVVAVPQAAEGAVSARTFTGTVVIPGNDGGPVPNAQIQLRGDWNQNDWNGYCSTAADAQGNFTLSGCNLDANTPFRLLIAPPQSLYSADDTVAAAGATILPGLNSTYTWAAVESNGLANLGPLSLQPANLKGTIKKQADDSSVTNNDFYSNIAVLSANGSMTNAQLPMFPYSNGTFRSSIQGTAYGVLIKADPQQNSAPGTFDDTYATGTAFVSQTQLDNGASGVDVVMPQVNFWGLVKKADGSPAPNIWVDGTLGSGGSQQNIWGRQTDSSGIIRLYIDRSLSGSSPGDEPVTLRMNFDNADGGQKQRTYMLADDSGTSADAPMVVEPQPNNAIVKVLRQTDSGPVADVGASVQVSLPDPCYMNCEVFSGTSNGSGEVAGYSDGMPQARRVWVNSTTPGYASFNGNVTPLLSNGMYVFTVTLNPTNFIIKVVRDDSVTGAPVPNVWANVNVPNCGGDGCQIIGGQTDNSGEVGGYSANPPSQVWVNVGGDGIPTGYASYGSMVATPAAVSGVRTLVITLMPINYVVTVKTPGLGSGVDSGGAQVGVSKPSTNIQYIQAQANSQGQASGHVPASAATQPVYVNVTPSSAAQAAGFTQFGGERTATWNPSTNRYELEVTLRRGNLTFQVELPDGTPVADAGVGLSSAGGMQWIGHQMTDNSGSVRFGVENPAGPFQVQISPMPAELSALGYAGFSGEVTPEVTSEGDSAQAQATITLQMANVAVTVRNELGEVIPQAGIWLQPVGANQGYNGQADNSGVIRLSVPDQFLRGLFYMNIQPPWYDQASYASRNYNETRLTCPGGEQPCTFDAVLEAPNARFLVVAPHSDAVVMPWANLEFRVPDDWAAGAWANSNQDGLAGASLEDNTYELNVQAPWNSQDDTMYATARYSVVVSGGAVASVTRNGVPATQQDGRWLVSPAVATYTATVVGPVGDDSKANSWVEVMKITEGGWQEYITGASTNSQGRVGFSLDDDVYVLRARAPWGMSGLAPASDCTLIIEDGAVAAGTTCGAILRLRAPNFRVRMVDPTETGVAGAWACVGRENDWNWSCEGSDFNGYASFMIDDTQAGDLIVEGNPPFSSEDFAPTRHIVSDDSFIGVDTLDDTLAFKVPNVRIQVSLDNDIEAARWSWVNIVRIVDEDTWQWLGGAPANFNGVAQFNIDDTSGEFCVEASPPWEVRETYGPQSECGVGLLSSGQLSIDLRTANVVTQVVDSDGRRNQFGWAEIQDLSPGGRRTGVGLDDRGRFAAALDPGTTYDITFYPGWQRSGSPTTVRVTPTQDGSNIPSTVQLGSGNVVGEVTSGGSPYAGVVVVAEQGGQRVAAVTDESGTFRLELGPGTWTLSAIPPPGGAAAAVSVTSGGAWASPQLVVP